MIKKILIFSFLLIGLFIFPSIAKAQEFTTDYQVEYFLAEGKDTIATKVDFTIQITNQRSDIYVSRFAISFPKVFNIHDLKAYDDSGEITPKVTTDDRKLKIDLEFSKPNIGRGSVNTFKILFNQENLFKINGNIWEVILPTIEDKGTNGYKIIVNLPPDTDKKISIAKPKPTNISGSQIVWDNPSSKTVYAVFGDSQLYFAEINYHLVNPKIIPVYTDIAFPPDTIYQKIYLGKINPLPIYVFRDEDGNYLGRYLLKPKEKKNVTLNTTVEVYAKSRDTTAQIFREEFEKQKDYLLTPKKYWQIKDVDRIKSLKNINDIYRFSTDNLQYNYKKITANNIRLGAEGALSNPNQAVCTEFTDLFVAVSREKGFYAREIEGYGFSADPELRPLSLVSDILHAWPEYYDKTTNLWVPVDPTWENTSGIDYFSSFDLNHIVFTIHGKRPDYPLPAGMYKTEDSKDIIVKAVATKPKEVIKISLLSFTLPTRLTDREKYKAKLTLINDGNVFAWNIPVEAVTKNLNASLNKITIPVLAPLEKKEITIELQSTYRNKRAPGEIALSILGNTVYNAKVSIIPYYYELALKIAFVVTAIVLVMSIIKLLRRHKSSS